MAIRTSDQISIVDLTDGYSVILTNDSYTFAGSTSAANAGSTTTTVVAMCGATQVAASVDLNDVVKPTGVTVTKDTDVTQPTLTISVANTVTTGGVVDIPVQLDNGNITIHKLFTFQIAFKGSQMKEIIHFSLPLAASRREKVLCYHRRRCKIDLGKSERGRARSANRGAP